MQEFDNCVNCHAELTDDQDAYCSDECKVENESPKTSVDAPSPRQQEVQGEIELALENGDNVEIDTNHD